MFSQEKLYLSSNPPGRTIVYGWYYTAVLPSLNVMNIPVPSHGYQQGQHTDIFENKLFDKNTFSTYRDQSANETIWLLNRSYIKHIWFNLCHPGGKDAYEKLKDKIKAVFYDKQCSAICELENTGFAVDTEDDKNIDFEIKSPSEIMLKGDFEDDNTILVKEEYFPRWKAYDDEGKELDIKMSDDGFIEIISSETGDILLVHKPLLPEKITGIITFVSILIIMFGLIRLEKDEK